ncbi:class I SAM-dependent methyltransferase [Pedobacter foliorum]|uniref:class I SAM-dependent methyltransferase n=1 Tax=Pedobacter foliorum TaxID=2739058 RepID=UPI0015637F48|nr:class I SAM-dependent methyltransferase [Pedobacter foliorum]NRF37222.1 class I SAM-dependent methyltransferase [Pedobacter foliorum]
MGTQAEEIREQQRMTWNKFSPGWKKWDEFTMNFLKPMGDAIIKNLELKDHDQVLDVAAGTGEPGLTIAGLIPNGKVIGTDLAEDMVTIAAENAEMKGLSNYEILTTDVCELPFEEDTFDAISCRMGFMFFPDMMLAARQMYRVLKAGGKLSTSVWDGPQHNDWITTIMSVIQRHVALPSPQPGAPGMFRCAEPDLIGDLFKKVGFRSIVSQEVRGKVDYQSFDRYWEIMLDMGGPIVTALSGVDKTTIAKIKAEVAELFKSKNKEGESTLEYAALVISAVK